MSFDGGNGGNGNGGTGGFGLQMRPTENGGRTAGTTGERDAWGHPLKNNDPAPKFDPVTGKPLPNTGDNTIVNDKMVDDLWNDIQLNPDDGKPKPQEIVIKQEPVVKSGAEQLKEHLASVGLGEFTLSDAEKQALQNGDFSSLTTKMHEMAVNSYTKALSGSQTIIQAEVKKAVEEATKNTKQYIEGKDSLEALHAAVPATKHPAIGPVAQTVMQRLLDRGATKSEAIEGVKRWSALFAKEMGFDTEVNSNRNTTFRGGNNQNSGNENWLNILSGK